MSDIATSYCALGDVAETNVETLPANTPPSARFRYIDLSAVEAGFINWGAVTETTFGAAPSRARRVVKGNDILFGTVRPNLKSHGLIGQGEQGPLIASTGFSVVSGRDGVSHPGYLFHSLMSNHVTAQAVRDAIGSSYPALNDSDVKRFQIFMPTYEEQQRISEVLDALDTAIYQTETIISKLKAIKQGLLHDLLTCGISTNGELRSPQAEAPHLYKQSSLGWIPKEWDAVKLTSLISSIGQGWSPDCESSPANSGSWGILKTTAITWAGYNDQENKALPLAFKARADLEVKAEDILITRAGPASRVGVIAYVESSREKLMISDKMYRLRTQPTELSAFISLALSSQAVQMELGRALSGMAESQTNISQKIVKELIVMRPLIEEQSAIADRVKTSEGRIREEEKSLEKLKILKSGLMDDLLTGHVRVTPLLAKVAQQHRSA